VLKRYPGLQNPVWRFEALLLSAAFWFLRILPPSLATALSSRCFALIGPLTDKADKVRQNLRIAFPSLDPSELHGLVKRTFAHLGMAMAELAQAPDVLENRKERLEILIKDDAIPAITSGNAVVFVTAHVEAWQYANMIGPWFGVSITSVYAPESNPYLRDRFLKLRQALGVQWLSRDNSMRKLIRELSNGRCIGFATDIRVDEGEMLPLFGKPAPTNTVPARLAVRFGCPLIAVRARRLPGQRYRIVLEKQIRPDATLANDEQRVVQMATQLNSEFERWIREAPGQWACMKRRWPKPKQE